MKKINDIEVGNRLTELRKSMGLTQMEVAQKLGINRSSLTRYENGERIPKANELVELSQLYKVTVDYILLGVTPENRKIYDITPLEDKTISYLKSLIDISTIEETKNETDGFATPILKTLNILVQEDQGREILKNINIYITKSETEILNSKFSQLLKDTGIAEKNELLERNKFMILNYIMTYLDELKNKYQNKDNTSTQK